MTAQSLYEKKLATYPRTDCRYLPEEQFGDAARIITALSGVSGLERSRLGYESEGSLIEAMASSHRFVSDTKAKAVLKENEGIGTEATRASILETLKGRGFITASGKSLVPTPLGQSLIDMSPDTLRDPVTTAQWEQRLEAITHGENSLEDFMGNSMQLFLCFWTPFSPLLPHFSPVPSPARRAAKRCVGAKGKTPANFSGAASMPIAGRSCRMKVETPARPKKSLRDMKCFLPWLSAMQIVLLEK